MIQPSGPALLHPHLHFLVTEGGVDEAGLFLKVSRIDDSRLTELFAREVLVDLVRTQLLSPEWVERLLSWRHSGFPVHSRVRAKTKTEAERVGKYMIRPLQVDLRRGETPSPSASFPGTLDGRRSRRRLLFMIFPWNRRGGLSDLRRFEASLRRSDLSPLVSAQFDRRQRRDLCSLRMSGGAKCHKEARSTGRAKNEILIN